MSAFDALLTFQRETEALGQVMGRLGWDQETVMPEGAIEQRAEEMAALEGVLHRRRTDTRIGDWLADARPEGPVQSRQIELIRHRYERTRKVPEDLSAALARTTSLAHRVWAEARAQDDFALFAPKLDEVLTLSREKASALAEDGNYLVAGSASVDGEGRMWVLKVRNDLHSPVASFTHDPASPVFRDQEITFDASASTAPGSFITGYTWDFGLN